MTETNIFEIKQEIYWFIEDSLETIGKIKIDKINELFNKEGEYKKEKYEEYKKMIERGEKIELNNEERYMSLLLIHFLRGISKQLFTKKEYENLKTKESEKEIVVVMKYIVKNMNPKISIMVRLIFQMLKNLNEKNMEIEKLTKNFEFILPNEDEKEKGEKEEGEEKKEEREKKKVELDEKEQEQKRKIIKTIIIGYQEIFEESGTERNRRRGTNINQEEKKTQTKTRRLSLSEKLHDIFANKRNSIIEKPVELKIGMQLKVNNRNSIIQQNEKSPINEKKIDDEKSLDDEKKKELERKKKR
jgi:hypothetical protein